MKITAIGLDIRYGKVCVSFICSEPCWQVSQEKNS